MPVICDLPTELRQRILALALPDVNPVGKQWPRPILSLVQINQQLRSDMGFVIDSWSPMHYIARGEDIPHLHSQSIQIRGQKHRPKILHICLAVFHGSNASQMMSTCWCFGHHQFCPPGFWHSWETAIPSLPSSATDICVDITPAPGEIQNRHGLTVNPFIHDKRTQHFLRSHSHEVAILVTLVNRHYSGRVPIRATGRLSKRSSFFVTRLKVETDYPIEFEGIWITDKDTAFADIYTAARKIARTEVGKQAERRGAPNRLAWLRDVRWSRQTSWTYAKVAHVGEEEEASQDLRKIVVFVGKEDKDVLEMGPVGDVRRALQHRMAEDLGLKTRSEGVGPERRVVVMKEQRPTVRTIMVTRAPRTSADLDPEF